MTNVAVQVSVTKKWASCTGIVATVTNAAVSAGGGAVGAAGQAEGQQDRHQVAEDRHHAPDPEDRQKRFQFSVVILPRIQPDEIGDEEGQAAVGELARARGTLSG